jgi:hypothetical protein
MTRARATLATGAVLLIGAAGCGGGDDDKSLSRAEYLKQGNAICKKGNAEIDAAGRKVANGGRPTPAQIKAFATGTLIPNVEAQIKDLRALKAPKEDADKFSALYDEADAALERIKGNPALVAADGPADPFFAVNKKASAYGLTECGSG